MGSVAPSLNVTLTDIQVGDHVVSLKTQPVVAQKALAAQWRCRSRWTS
jgi:hypothetical protein